MTGCSVMNTGEGVLRIVISVPHETLHECYAAVIPNLRAALEEYFGEPHARCVEAGVRRTDTACVDISAWSVPGAEEGLTFVLNSVVTTLGHEYNGKITDEVSRKVILQKVSVHA